MNFRISNEVFNQTIVTAIIGSIALTVIFYIILTPITNILNMNEIVAKYFIAYYRIMIVAYPIMIVNSAMGMFVRGEGKPQLYMLINIVTVINNIVLDYVFIRTLKLGIGGAAVASLISLLIGSILMILFFLKKSEVYKFMKFKFSKEVLKDTVFNGSAEFIGQVSMSISMFAYNWVILKNVGVSGVAAFTIVGYVAPITEGLTIILTFFLILNHKEKSLKGLLEEV